MTNKLKEPPNILFKIIDTPFKPPSIIELGIKNISKAAAAMIAPKVIKINDGSCLIAKRSLLLFIKRLIPFTSFKAHIGMKALN